MEDFLKKSYRSEMDYSNQTILFCEVGPHHQNVIAESKLQTITLEARTLILQAKIYWPEAITTRLWTCALKDFSGKLNKIKVNYDEITPMENLSVITTYITLKKTTHGAVKFMSWIQDCKGKFS